MKYKYMCLSRDTRSHDLSILGRKGFSEDLRVVSAPGGSRRDDGSKPAVDGFKKGYVRL